MNNPADTNMQLDKVNHRLHMALAYYDRALHALFIAGCSDTLTDEETTQLNDLDTQLNNTCNNIYRNIDDLTRLRICYQLRQAKDRNIEH